MTGVGSQEERSVGVGRGGAELPRPLHTGLEAGAPTRPCVGEGTQSSVSWRDRISSRLSASCLIWYPCGSEQVTAPLSTSVS